ncbi:MAG: hypothetical protein ABW201_18515 [Candidatus Thiodiazotropha sp.]
MNTECLKRTANAVAFGAALLSGANIAWSSTFGSDDDQETYQLTAKQDTQKPYQYVDLQSGEVIKTSTMWRCNNANGKSIKKYVELPTGKILHSNCGK